VAEIRAALAPGTPLEVWFQDEMRVGQKNKLTYRWARKGSRPRAAHDQRTQSTYLFGAVCPERGAGAALVLPACNCEAMQLHLDEIATKVAPGAHAICAGAFRAEQALTKDRVLVLVRPPLCCRRPPLRPRMLNMKPEHEARRKIIREWMLLPKDKRQTEEQAKLFAKKAMERIPSSGDPYRQIMRWLLPRIGKP
jgi:hypothetical protein